MMNSIDQIVSETIEVAKKAGRFIRKESEGFDSSKIETKGLHDLVSYVDRNAEKIIIEGLQEILPESGFLTEEGMIESERKEYTWIVDPLDGTTNFLHGLPIYAVSIALMHNDELLLGVVFEPNRDEVFSAIKGKGAFCNGERISVSDKSDLGESLIATGFPFTYFEHLDSYLKILESLMRSTHGIRRMGTAAVDLVYVACGRMDAFFEYNLKPWDVAAGALIVSEAGGQVSDFHAGGDYVFGKEIVAGGNVTKQLLASISKYWK
ncbi:inositol monophosphatase family protein [Aureibacter tunicatorum]|uniref:Inositol-1-monophosphatase n=1 Tax=Aureibacter tunicatorum TaxID=866807 RepID=A0AAE4BRR6_9BACT|nr:inositol monophosphatase family protein [Aureibacter tunicatorum]MDR6237507.1 myo-inositol-1(or 4)-monophosphatase [Aureibacter tunicatorum]